MKPFTRLALALTVAASAPVASFAGPIEQACLRSDRPSANRAVCGCVQDAANLTLNNSDQKLAASFFKDPQKAQDIRQSDRSSHEAFWKRYREFGEAAETFCG